MSGPVERWRATARAAKAATEAGTMTLALARRLFADGAAALRSGQLGGTPDELALRASLLSHLALEHALRGNVERAEELRAAAHGVAAMLAPAGSA